ncbi:DUF4365 domain-containing protein [Paraliomyxa miuraensis]|uniref:DUF4365 domain-containing protein n=1 Tax=Paraliomyxa miuraensis TaxID=376150 RepID=UPI00224F9C9B|nr:DUF4365 domain-containing protein [Paraliomyxa miuraensis]MCX4241639.1 DUF4365 domain-containing protein [Paraliomyxa miuraensis]
MTPEQQREELSKAYVAAIAARCGFKLGVWSQDDDCLDVTIGSAGVLGGGILAGPKLDLQLKSSSDQRHVHDDYISWSLSRSHYDKLRSDACSPRILVVLMLPKEELEWVRHSPESLVLRRCAYWDSLHGRGPIEDTRDSTTVRIPKQKVLSPTALHSLMVKVSRKEPL